MKIENGIMASIPKIDVQAKPAGTQAAGETTLQPKQNDRAYTVEISPAAGQLQIPDRNDQVTHERIAAIRDQLAAGTYNISGRDVASKILNVLKK